MNGGDILIDAWSSAAAPPPLLSVSEWAEANRRLPETSSARGAPWRNETTPYLKGIMDAVLEPGVTKLALMKAVQSGGSEALHNILGYFIQYDPSPMLFVHPTAMVAEEWSKERLADMLRSTPALRAVVRDRRQPRKSHEAESTLSLKIFPGGYLALGGANTPNTFARRSVRFAFADDFARFPYVVGEEGDPGDLLVNRTTTFHDGLSMFVSTPALKGDRIDTLFSRSDRRRYHVACPHCGREDWLTWREPDHFRVTYDGDNPETARLECPSEEHGGCGARMDEAERRRMIGEAGARPDSGWRATAEPQESGLVGFHLPAMVSTLGVTLSGLVEQWLSARARGNESLRVFINTVLGEGWELRGTRVDAHTLLDRRESYGNEAEEKEHEKQARRADRKAAKAEERGDLEKAAELRAEAAAPPPPPAVVPTSVPKVAGVTKRESWKFKFSPNGVEQQKQLLKKAVVQYNASVKPGEPELAGAEFWALDEKTIGAVVRSTKGQIEIPGVDIYSETIRPTRAS